jgi:hypothetical protein
MALSLAEANKFSTNQVLIGVAETSIDANPLLGLMPFVPIRGNALQYQRENAASAPTFIAPGGVVTEGVPTVTQLTTALRSHHRRRHRQVPAHHLLHDQDRHRAPHHQARNLPTPGARKPSTAASTATPTSSTACTRSSATT